MAVNTQSETDAHWMRAAVAMAESGLGTTAPNPSVGAVLVFDGVEIARAVTQQGGRPHAETEALRLAGEAARGATLYVTLEPCSHHGKTGPCAEAVIAAGVPRVVVGLEDPDPRVAGRGIALLRAAGIEVVVGVEAKACRWVTLGHILRVTERRPMVLLKMALRDDLSVPTGGGGRPNFVTSPEARMMGHRFRAKSDAILVGAGTVRDDDPELTVRAPGLEHRRPIRVVLDSRLDALTPATKLAQTARDVPVWVMTTSAAPYDSSIALEDLGVRVSTLYSEDGRPDFECVLRLLADAGITRLMIEGGPAIWRRVAAHDCIDEAIVFVSRPPHSAATDGGAGFDPPVTFERLTRLHLPSEMDLVEQGEIGGDTWFRFEREGTS